MNRILVGSLLAFSLVVAPTFGGAKSVTRDGLNAIVPGLGSKVLGKHDVVPPIKLTNGKVMWILELRDEGGSRCTNDFSVEDAHDGYYICHIDTSAKATTKAQLQFQRKGNKVPGDDSDRGIAPGGPRKAPFGHNTKVWLDGSRNYLAQRGIDVAKILSEDPTAVVVLYPEGMTLEEALASIGTEQE